jgi:hypothetical protein
MLLPPLATPASWNALTCSALEQGKPMLPQLACVAALPSIGLVTPNEPVFVRYQMRPLGSAPSEIVSKRRDSRYRSGRSLNWIKSKNPNPPAAKRRAEEDWGPVKNPGLQAWGFAAVRVSLIGGVIWPYRNFRPRAKPKGSGPPLAKRKLRLLRRTPALARLSPSAGPRGALQVSTA